MRRLPSVDGDPPRLAQRGVGEPHPVSSETWTITEARAAAEAERLTQRGQVHPAAVVEHGDLDRLLLVVAGLGRHGDRDARRARLDRVVDELGDRAGGAL